MNSTDDANKKRLGAGMSLQAICLGAMMLVGAVVLLAVEHLPWLALLFAALGATAVFMGVRRMRRL